MKSVSILLFLKLHNYSMPGGELYDRIKKRFDYKTTFTEKGT